MSVTKETTVWCDSCTEWHQSSDNAAKLRRDLHRQGWRTLPGGRDMCGDCVAERKVRGQSNA